MMHLAHQDPPPCSALLLWSWSRFARDQDDAHYWKASLRRHGVDIHDVSGETPDVQGGFEYVFESLIHWKDEEKRKEIARNARRGQQTQAKMGYVPSGARPPRGYMVAFEEREIEGRRRRLRRWVPYPESWPLVGRAWQIRLQGHSYKATWREVGLYSTPYCFSTFFSNAIYKGELWFGGTLIPVPPVVTSEDWAQVNRGRAQREGGAYPRRQGSRFLLSGLLHCARCGSALAGDYGGSGRRNDGYERAQWNCYVCPKKKRRQCDLRRCKAESLESAVIDTVFEQILTEENLAIQFPRIQAQRDADRPALEAELLSVERQVVRVDVAIGRLLDATEERSDTRSLPDRVPEREAERDRLNRRKTELEAQLRVLPAPIEDMAKVREALRLALAHGPPQVGRSLLQRIIADILVDDDVLRIRYKLPFASTGIRSVPPGEG